MRELEPTEVPNPVSLRAQKVVRMKVEKHGGMDWAIIVCHHAAMNHLYRYGKPLPLGSSAAELRRVADEIEAVGGEIDRVWFDAGIKKRSWSDLFKVEKNVIVVG